MKRSRITGIALAAANGILIIVCAFLYLGKDRDKPEITFEAVDTVYREGMETEELLKGVTAYDTQDGDLSGRIVIEKISENRENGTAVVFYAVSDKAGNVARASRVLEAVFIEKKEESGAEGEAAGKFLEVGIAAELKEGNVVNGRVMDKETEDEGSIKGNTEEDEDSISDNAEEGINYGGENGRENNVEGISGGAVAGMEGVNGRAGNGAEGTGEGINDSRRNSAENTGEGTPAPTARPTPTGRPTPTPASSSNPEQEGTSEQERIPEAEIAPEHPTTPAPDNEAGPASNTNTQAPVLSLKVSEVEVKAGQGPAWVDLIETLSDDKDGYETLFRNLNVSRYDRNKPGTYQVSVSTEDSDGNRSEAVSLTIIVK